MPWKNGGGVTTEILVEPGREGRFAYRVSIAEVAVDGPFSRFEGYDRHIFLLDGAGMVLECDHGPIALARFEPKSFDGDWDVYGRLAAGPVRDFNLIVDRAWGRSALEVREVTGAVSIEADVCIVHVLDGDTFVAEGQLELDVGAARIAIARLLQNDAG